MDEITTRLATMEDYDDLGRLYQQLDDHHVQLLPDIFQPFPSPPRTRERVQEFIDSETADYILV